MRFLALQHLRFGLVLLLLGSVNQAYSLAQTLEEVVEVPEPTLDGAEGTSGWGGGGPGHGPGSDGLLVNTAEGPVLGSVPLPGVRQWLGIPFARANRWEAPQPPAIRRTTFAATNFGKTCPQFIVPGYQKYLELVHQNDTVTEGEECLNANVWAPARRRKQGTAVLVWIYGGGFQFGSNALRAFNGKRFVANNDDVTFVSINYRTNLFGQPAAPQLSGLPSQNFGMLDIRAAVQWIHANIAAFGGDPNRISISGHSAGGAAVGLYTLAYPGDHIVKGIIESSGTIFALAGLISPTLNPVPWNTIAETVNCGSTPTPAQFNCMKGKPWSSLLSAAHSTGIGFFGILKDDLTAFTDYEARIAAGNFLKVPTLTANVANEGDSIWVGFHTAMYGHSFPFLTGVISDIDTQVVGICPASKASEERLKQGVKVWRYIYQATIPGISQRQNLRAFHAADTPINFGTYPDIHSSSLTTPQEIALSEYTQGAWSAFVRDPMGGLTGYGWPLYNPARGSQGMVYVGDRANRNGATFGEAWLADAACGNVPALLNASAQFSALLPPP